MNRMSHRLAISALVLLTFGPFSSVAQDASADAAAAALDAQLAATKAMLAGTAEGLYRGCKASVELRAGQPSEPNLVLAFDLASECDAYAQGVSTTIAISYPVMFGGSCSINAPIEPAQFVDSVVQAVESNPLLVGQTSSQQQLTFQALKLVAQCQTNEG